MCPLVRSSKKSVGRIRCALLFWRPFQIGDRPSSLSGNRWVWRNPAVINVCHTRSGCIVLLAAAPLGAASRSRKEDDMTRLAFTRVGSGPPLVLLHAIGLSRRTWDPVVPALAEHFD